MTSLLKRSIPVVFVLLWASGFVVARLVRPYAEPLSFVTLRFSISLVVLALIAVVSGARWPRGRGWIDGLVAGALMQGVYVGGVFWSIKHGLPSAVAALIAGLQPLLTALLATPLLGEPVGRKRWAGIALGFFGALLVLAPNVTGRAAIPFAAVASCLLGMTGITLGTIWQKRVGAAADLRCALVVQLAGGLLVIVPIMLATEHGRVANAPDVWIGLAYAVVVLSVVAAFLLLFLIRAGEVAGVAALFYLVPPVTALMAFGLFGEALVPIQFAGMILAGVGVAVANQAVETPAPLGEGGARLSP